MRCLVMSLAAVAMAVVLAEGPAVADTAISLTNPSFEGTSGWPKITDGFDDATYDVIGWSNGGSNYSDAGIDWTLGGLGAHSGGWSAYLCSTDSSVKQDTNYTIAAGDTFTLTFWSACTQSGGYLNASLYYQTESGRVNLATKSATAPTWTEFTLTGQASDAAVGKVLGVEFSGNTSDARAWPLLDDVAISVHTVPEPSSVMLTAASAIGLLAYAWRKRQ